MRVYTLMVIWAIPPAETINTRTDITQPKNTPQCEPVNNHHQQNYKLPAVKVKGGLIR